MGNIRLLRSSDRNNLIFPILYVPVPALTDDRWRQDPLLAIIGSRQYEDWQNLRHLDASSSEVVALRVEKFCANICRALEQEWLSPEERREAEARRAAEAERRRLLPFYYSSSLVHSGDGILVLCYGSSSGMKKNRSGGSMVLCSSYRLSYALGWHFGCFQGGLVNDA